MTSSPTRRQTLLASLGLAALDPVVSAGARMRSESGVSSHEPLNVGVLSTVSTTNIPGDIDRIRTSGFWIEGEGEQVFDRAQTETQLATWPICVRSADGSLWIASERNVQCSVFGEVADGDYHPLSRRFGTLEQARLAYPFATSLNQSIDWAAAQSLALFSRGAEGEFTPGIRIITDPIRIPARVILKGCSTAPNSLVFRAHAGSGGFSKGRGVFESFDFWNHAKPDYWHWSALQRLTVDCASVSDFGIALWCMGEHSLLQDVSASHAKVANIFIGGYGAVGTLNNCSVWNSARFGVLLGHHPSPTFPKAGVVAKQGSGGSYRITNLSGDQNPVHISADGTQIVQLFGLKSEFSPVVVLVTGEAYGPGRQRWDIAGYRAEGAKVGTSFLQIEGSGTPSIRIGPGAAYNYPTLIQDNSIKGRGRQVSSGKAGINSLNYGLDDADSAIFATDRISFFGAAPSSHVRLPPRLTADATEAQCIEMLNEIHRLLTSYGLG